MFQISARTELLHMKFLWKGLTYIKFSINVISSSSDFSSSSSSPIVIINILIIISFVLQFLENSNKIDYQRPNPWSSMYDFCFPFSPAKYVSPLPLSFHTYLPIALAITLTSLAAPCKNTSALPVVLSHHGSSLFYTAIDHYYFYWLSRWGGMNSTFSYATSGSDIRS